MTSDEGRNRQSRHLFGAAVVQALRTLYAHRHERRTMTHRQHDEKVLQQDYIESLRATHKILEKRDRDFFELVRMKQSTFWQLVAWLKRAGLEDTQYQTGYQKVLIFLYIAAQNATQRSAADRFCCAQSSISTAFHAVLRLMGKLFKAVVQLPSSDYLAPEVELHKTLHHFSGCIGAIDGTHIHAFIPVKHQKIWRNRKGWISQNVFAAVRMDGTFSYVLAGAEGSMHDSKLKEFAFHHGFKIPENRFYLADAGFGDKTNGILVPYWDVRYHLQEWRSGDRRPQTAKELYNLRHSRLRVVVERIFGIVKRQWKIVRFSAPEYDIKTQIRLVYAVCALHNFIRQQTNPRSILNDDEVQYINRARQRCERRIRGVANRQIQHHIAVRSWRSYMDYLRVRNI